MVNKEKTNPSISVLGSGWLGLSLVDEMVTKGFIVKGSTTSESKLKLIEKIGAKPFVIDIDNLITTNIRNFLETEILIVNITSKSVEGFQNLINFINNSPVEKVIFVSSTSVYPFTNNEVTEKSSLKECALATIESLFQSSTHFKTTVLRFSGLYNEQRHPGNFMKKGRIIQNPDGYVNLIHKGDCIGIILEVLKQECWGEVFNGCSNNHPKRKDFYIEQTKLIGRDSPIFNYSKPTQFKIIDNSKLKRVLNYSFKHDL
ncbi:dTDP-glucose 4,6-dehydratase [Urechidicola vernalis]|uniref:dTDP-glucose 4,6-dehydratase n=1 Tax=Urechidicola vernalis TaxID=3075600 RepID=A0ABU2Y2B3_9FLAO|nr:dTDP-glucose 4,6-dehydratase [Urechidicola sp. P050]MDT0551951.1 dTDP-glucose 4,6-dehydratase [Urechidicola sp. P050]